MFCLFKIIECSYNGFSSTSGCPDLKLISQNFNFNYSSQILSDLILQKFMLGQYALKARCLVNHLDGRNRTMVIAESL